MDFGLDQLLARLALAGPLLYIGLVMVIDPAGFMSIAQSLALLLRSFEQRMRGITWQAGPLESAAPHPSMQAVKTLRFAGIGLIGFAMLVLSGLLNWAVR